MTAIRLKNLTKRFGETRALDDVSLDFAQGSFNALLGPSGCGKTTLLRLVAGFEAPSEGSVHFADRLVADPQNQVPPERRGIGVVFQSYALWPHMDVADNVAYPLKMQKAPRETISARLREVLDIVGLAGFESRKVDELSGGQRQRVALARCLIAGTGIILFDEPLANLDVHLRASMVEVFRDIHRRVGATIVYVTHDQSEALALADRVAVMQDGRVLQFAPPEEVYHRPADAAVARFVGRGSLVSGIMVRKGGIAEVEIAGQRIVARLNGRTDGPAMVLLRPEHMRLGDAGLTAKVLSSTYRGPVHELRLALADTGEELVVDSPTRAAAGEMVRVAVTDAWIIPSR
jgi:iron(III) transport system ATP-binding protein